MQGEHPKIVVDRVKSLPTLPQIFYKIIELIDSPDSSVSDLERIVTQDPSIAAKILKVANSPLYTAGKTCVGIHQAIVRLGFETLKSIVLSVSIFKFTPGKSSAIIFSREDFWRHSIGAAEAARMIAKKINYANSDEAYLIGLIHDIGKVILDFYFAPEYTKVGAYIMEHNCSILEAEQKILGFDHSAVGGWLAEKWKFPEQLQASIEYHHKIDKVPREFAVQAAFAHLGDHIVRKVEFGSGGDTLVPDVAKKALVLKNFSRREIDDISTGFQDKRELIEETCGIID